MKNQYRRNECLIYTHWISFCPLYTSVGRVRLLGWKRAQHFFGESRSSEMNEMSRVKSNVYPNDLQHLFFCFRNWAKKFRWWCAWVLIARAPSSSAVVKSRETFFFSRDDRATISDDERRRNRKNRNIRNSLSIVAQNQSRRWKNWWKNYVLIVCASILNCLHRTEFPSIIISHP